MWRWFRVLFVLYASSALYAGQIYGTLRENGRGVAGVRVEIIPQGKGPYVATTGADGSYRIFVKETGRCEFRVVYRGSSVPAANVFSYATPVKYDFDLVVNNGQYYLRGK